MAAKFTRSRCCSRRNTKKIYKVKWIFFFLNVCETAVSCAGARPNHVMYIQPQEGNELQDQLLIVWSQPDSWKRAPGFWQLTQLPIFCQTQQRSKSDGACCQTTLWICLHRSYSSYRHDINQTQTASLPELLRYLFYNMSNHSETG